MLLKYTGPKPIKTVEHNSRKFTFDPICDVNDPETVKFLLHRDRQGLFVELSDEDVAKASAKKEKTTKTTKKVEKPVPEAPAANENAQNDAPPAPALDAPGTSAPAGAADEEI